MNRLSTLVLATASMASIFGANISLNTGVANWQVLNGGAFVSAVAVAANPLWAPAPTGSSWVSYSAVQSTSCTGNLVPGTTCASNLINAAGDLWTYQLVLSAAQLNSTVGSLSFVFGADNRVNLFAGNNNLRENWGGFTSPGNGYSALGCSALPVPTNAGSTNPYTCNTSLSYNAGSLNGDGSLTITAYVFNDPQTGVGNPTGFVLAGTAATGAPEPATFGLVGVASLIGLAVRRMRKQNS